jgi:altronate hydrolase
LHKFPAALQIHPADSVAVALRAIAAGEEIAGVPATSDIPQGHKLALVDLPAGTVVMKYGQPIGRASAAIAAGDHVHSHNLVTALAGELTYRPGSVAVSVVAATGLPTWQGYLRDDGCAATRNEIWILPSVGCVGITAEEVARTAHARHAGRVDGVYAFAHPHGCSQLGDDLAGTRDLLAGLATNPNAAGVLLLGLGCESNQLDALLEAVPPAARGKVRLLSSQSAGDELAAAAADR